MAARIKLSKPKRTNGPLGLHLSNRYPPNFVVMSMPADPASVNTPLTEPLTSGGAYE